MSNTATLTELAVLQTLEQAGNPQQAGSQVQKSAEQQLKQWEIQPGYHYYLQSIYLDLSNTLQSRWLAAIQFKNGVDRYWRSSRVHAINKDEKASIRARLFELIDEQNNQLGIQYAQAIAKIARLDFPAEWPDLFEHLESLLSDHNVRCNNVKVYNMLMYINQIIKVLGTARIGRCKPAMQSKVPLIFPLIVRIYLESFDDWTKSKSLSDDDLSKLQVSYLSLKVLRRIVCEGYERPQKDESVCEFMKLSITHFELLLANQEFFNKFDLYEKFIKCYGKLYYNLVTSSPANFILLPCSTSILIVYTKLLFEKAQIVYQENVDVTGDFWEHAAIRGFLLLKRVINFTNKKGVITLKVRSDKASIESSIMKINNEFLHENLVKKLLDVLMDWYLKLRPSELESWFLDPEEWINEQIVASYEYQIRPCAENFFQDLINSFPELLVPYLLNKIENEANHLGDDLDGFLKKDAIYASFQLSASAVSDMVDFDRLLVQVFLPEASNNNTQPDQLKIIRRRVALIIHEWSTVKCSEQSKALCYEFFKNVLASDEDKVVQLTVVQSLRTMIDDWNFNKDVFEPFLTDIVTVLLRKILPSVSLTETRMYVLNTLSDIISQTKPLIDQKLLIEILQVVPNLWEHAANNTSESILANTLLRLLKYLAISLGPHSYLTWDIAIPIISVACNPESSHYQLLNEDGYELWGALLQNYSPKEQSFNTTFIDLLPYLEFGIEAHTEILPTLLELIRSYMLILTQEQIFACESFQRIFTEIARFLLKLREDSFELILQIWEILVLANESDYENALLTNFYQANILSSLFDSVFKEERLSNYQCGQILQIIARISYANPDALLEFLQNYHSQLPTMNENSLLPIHDRRCVYGDMTFEQVIQRFISIWIVCFKDIYDPKFKKVHILGISSLLRSKILVVLTEFENIISLWIDILEEINETSDGDCEKYHLNDIVTEQSMSYHPLTSEQLREHELSKNNDPVHNISLKEFIEQTLRFLEDFLGMGRYNELLSNVNPNLIENLKLFLSLKK
ncbi:karyopherin KAP120 NDAI_0E02170 [Naumovozyma dairenensis CBS 421]|uniref:Importin N-terminal domain-containing protein n=1 Tax=Naumovozyma dairenensis (strain ATCC 10597 / BCRC 20456 / CBS 421 / NBRC 0211 / NRRL Y-12639) TaxID=1071378 RepID=G0WBB4_NAUDC|nr:hypothetical protein NDAI_0E02170 [Naumovozyma dairenensis CBS 421]CCD25034.1 hypothetical protein NDAI_0E02170 [Naumovozyma dairenensis CBS 421]